jgi:hypothetical protein
MAEQKPTVQFKAEMPSIPGVRGGARPASRTIPGGYIAAGVFMLLAGMLAIGLTMRPRHAQAVVASAPAQLEVPPPVSSTTWPPGTQPAGAATEAVDAEQVIATTSEMAKVWSAKDFLYRNPLTAWSTPAMLVRLPLGSATQASGYWAFAVNAAYGNCKLEYVTDVKRLVEEFGYRRARHPMLVNPCNRAVIDPLKLSSLPGGAWVRGEIVQGADMRPPLAIEVKIKGQRIIANRME